MKRLSFSVTTLVFMTGCYEYYDKSDYTSYSGDSETLVHDGVEREFIVYVPDSYDGSEDVPLFLNFHGFDGTAGSFMEWTDMQTVADNENFILVYPQGTLLDGSPHWNSGLDTPDNKSSADDYGFVDVLIDDLSSRYRIDTDRVYAAGYSNGAFFSFALACYHGDKIAAVGSVSGTMMTETREECNPQHPTSVIVLHGTDDTMMHVGGDGLESASDSVEYWVDFNNTNQTPDVNQSNNVVHSTFSNGDSGTSVEHFEIRGGDHVWFDLQYQGASTGQLIWDFVSQYDVNGKIQ